jgi:hypothetical protein
MANHLMKTVLTSFLLVTFGVGVPLAGAERKILAVFDIDDKTNKFNRQSRMELTDYLAAQLAQGNLFKVVPRSQLKERLQANKKASYKACFDERCQIEIGRELAAEKSLATKIIKVGSKCALMATLFDLKTSTSEAAATQKAKCNQDDLVTALEKVAAEIKRSASGRGGKSAVRVTAPPSSPPPPVEPPDEVEGTQPAKVAPTPAPAATAAPATAPQSAPQASTPIYKKWWLWTIVGVVVVGGVVAAVVLTQGGDDTTAGTWGASLHSRSGAALISW